MENITEALKWITEVLKSKHIPFQVVGGLAAVAYGATRSIKDIDIYMPLDRFYDIGQDIGPYKIWGPAHHVDDVWNIFFVKLEYKGVVIKLSDAFKTKMYDKANKRWVTLRIEFSHSQDCRVYDVLVPVMPKMQLVEYKSLLDRDIDKKDIEEIL